MFARKFAMKMLMPTPGNIKVGSGGGFIISHKCFAKKKSKKRVMQL